MTLATFNFLSSPLKNMSVFGAFAPWISPTKHTSWCSTLWTISGNVGESQVHSFCLWFAGTRKICLLSSPILKSPRNAIIQFFKMFHQSGAHNLREASFRFHRPRESTASRICCRMPSSVIPIPSVGCKRYLSWQRVIDRDGAEG